MKRGGGDIEKTSGRISGNDLERSIATDGNNLYI